MIWSV